MDFGLNSKVTQESTLANNRSAKLSLETKFDWENDHLADVSTPNFSFLKESNPLLHKFLGLDDVGSSMADEINVGSKQAFDSLTPTDSNIFDALFSKVLRTYEDDGDDTFTECHNVPSMDPSHLNDEIAKAIVLPPKSLNPGTNFNMSKADKDRTLSLASLFEKRCTIKLPNRLNEIKEESSSVTARRVPFTPKLIKLGRPHTSTTISHTFVSRPSSPSIPSYHVDLQRPRYETLDEKRTRKALVKAQKKAARERKSSTKQFFKQASVFAKCAQQNGPAGKSLSRVC